jgi:divalent metal cation (Fe/Co/Zn/Cd) transporter
LGSPSGDSRRWVRRRPVRTAFRKVLLAAALVRVVEEIALASLGLALVGFALYTLVYPSGVVLFEALVWSIEAMAFTGISLAMRVASSRAVFYRARYEIFRLEALAVVLLSATGMVVTILVILRSLRGPHRPSPPLLGLYPLLSAAASYGLDSLLHRRASSYAIRLVSLKAVSSKLRYDVLFEVAGGAGILASNALHSGAVEAATLVVVGSYVIYGLALIAAEHMLYLVGPGPHHRRVELRARIRNEARRLGLRVAKSRIEVYGTFAEAEVWIPLDPFSTLSEAHRRARELARHLIHSVPELLRVVVVPIPSQAQPRRGRRYRRREKSPASPQRGPEGEPSTSRGRARSR